MSPWRPIEGTRRRFRQSGPTIRLEPTIGLPQGFLRIQPLLPGPGGEGEKQVPQGLGPLGTRPCLRCSKRPVEVGLKPRPVTGAVILSDAELNGPFLEFLGPTQSGQGSRHPGEGGVRSRGL